MNNAEKILTCLDQKLHSRVELILCGRAVLLSGFDDRPLEIHEQFERASRRFLETVNVRPHE